MKEHDLAHSAAHASAVHAHHEPHELPNFLKVLTGHFPDSEILKFLGQWENAFFTALILSLLCFTAIRASRTGSLVPKSLQNFWEVLVEAIYTFVCGILGPKHGPKHVAFLGTLFFYVLLMNWAGMVPLMKSPTAAWSTTITLGFITMFYVQTTGLREQGLVKYLKHIAGNPQGFLGLALVVLMLPLNIILEFLAAPFSLSLRLFANVSSEDRLLLNFANLTLNSPFRIGFLFQIFANILTVVFSFIQAFVFMLLSTVYISLVLPHDEHGEDEHSDSTPAHLTPKGEH